jgi:hypothetical protein
VGHFCTEQQHRLASNEQSSRSCSSCCYHRLTNLVHAAAATSDSPLQPNIRARTRVLPQHCRYVLPASQLSALSAALPGLDLSHISPCAALPGLDLSHISPCAALPGLDLSHISPCAVVAGDEQHVGSLMQLLAKLSHMPEGGQVVLNRKSYYNV